MRFRMLAASLAMLAPISVRPAVAEDPKPPVAAVKAQVPVFPSGGFAFLDATESESDFPLAWSVEPAAIVLPMDPTIAIRPSKLGLYGIVPPSPDGEYVATVAATKLIDGKPVIAMSSTRFRFGRVPNPPGPNDPGGVVEPSRPQPPPTSVSPVPAGKMRVLILFDPATNLSPQQKIVIYSPTKVSTYLESKCAKEPDGRASWRCWKKSDSPPGEPAEWKQVLEAAKADATVFPKVMVFSDTALVGSRVLVGESETLAFLQEFGGK